MHVLEIIYLNLHMIIHNNFHLLHLNFHLFVNKNIHMNIDNDFYNNVIIHGFIIVYLNVHLD